MLFQIEVPYGTSTVLQYTCIPGRKKERFSWLFNFNFPTLSVSSPAAPTRVLRILNSHAHTNLHSDSNFWVQYAWCVYPVEIRNVLRFSLGAGHYILAGLIWPTALLKKAKFYGTGSPRVRVGDGGICVPAAIRVQTMGVLPTVVPYVVG